MYETFYLYVEWQILYIHIKRNTEYDLNSSGNEIEVACYPSMNAQHKHYSNINIIFIS